MSTTKAKVIAALNPINFATGRNFTLKTQGDRGVYYAFLACIVGFLVFAGIQASNFFTEANQSTDPLSPDIDKLKRTSARGAFASLVSILCVSVFIQGLFKSGADLDAATTSTLLSLIFGGTFGFILDSALGSDEGFSRDTVGGKFKYAFGSLRSAKYARYLVTVMFDLFLSAIMIKYTQDAVVNMPFFRENRNTAEITTTMFVSTLTFMSYANLTRFAWAYPATSSQTTDSWMDATTLQVLTNVVAMLFLVSDTVPKGGKAQGINAPLAKVVVALTTLCLVVGLQKWETIRPTPDVSVVPDNNFIGVYNGEKALDMTLEHAHDTFEGDQAIPKGTYKIVDLVQQDGDKYIYRLRSMAPRFKYETSMVDGVDPADRFVQGIGIFLGIAAATGGYTFLNASGRKGTRFGWLAAFMGYATLLTTPALIG